MGGGILAQALLKNAPGVSNRLSHVVLISLGLFYNMNFYGRLKAETHLLERLVLQTSFLNPRVSKNLEPIAPWPDLLEDLYKVWRVPYGKARLEADDVYKHDRFVREMFNRISFLIGEPYIESKLVPEIQNTTVTIKVTKKIDRPLPVGVVVRGCSEAVKGRLVYPVTKDDTDIVLQPCSGGFKVGDLLLAEGQEVGTVASEPVIRKPLLPELFGAMALQLYLHGAENLRAGQAVAFNADSTAPPDPPHRWQRFRLSGLRRAETHDADRRGAEPALASQQH